MSIKQNTIVKHKNKNIKNIENTNIKKQKKTKEI